MLSAHTSPSIHAHDAATAPPAHLEYLHNRARIARLLADGVIDPIQSALCVDHARPGRGIEFSELDAQRYEV